MTALNNLIEALSKLEDAEPKQTNDALDFSNEGVAPNDIAPHIKTLLQEGIQHQQHDWSSHMTAPVSEQALIGQLIASLHNGNLLSSELYPLLTSIEQQTLTWLCELFEQQTVHVTAGSSYGNIEALWQAKQHQPDRNIVFASQATHYSISKACQILGLDLRLIPCNKQEQIDVKHLSAACEERAPLAIVINAGTSSSGAFDPVQNCLEIAQRYDAWSHIDAAWGGALKILPESKSLFGPTLSKANSLCFDPHKAWAQAKPSSFIFFQSTKVNLMMDTAYLQERPQWQLHGSRGGEATLGLWLTLLSGGISGLKDFCQQALNEAQSFANTLGKQTHWQVYNNHTGIICFETNNDLSHLVNAGVVSMTKLNDRPVYRSIFIGPHVSAEKLITQLQPYF